MAIDHVLLLVIMFLKSQLNLNINFNFTLFITKAFDLVQVLLRYINYN